MYYAVTAKCGHTGFGNNSFIMITFAVNAETAKAAAKIARGLPRVKHDHKDAIVNVHAVQKNEYISILICNDLDPFLKVKSIQEQRRSIPYEDIVTRVHLEEVRTPKGQFDFGCNNVRYYCGKMKIRNPRKYYQHITSDYNWLSRVI